MSETNESAQSPESKESNEEVEGVQSTETVERSQFEHAMQDIQKLKSQKRDLETQLQNQKLTKLQENQEWQKVAELREREAQEATARASRVEESYLKERKFSAVKEEALKLGILPDALRDLELLSFEDVQIETTDLGRMNVLGATSEVEKLRTLRPHWFKDKSTPNLNTSTPDVVAGSSVSFEDVMKAKQKAGKTRSQEDYKVYESRLRSYQKSLG